MDTACASETKTRQAEFFRPWSTTGNLLVSVSKTTRQGINYFYVNEAISMSEHRAPTYQLQLAMASFTTYSVLLYVLLTWGLGARYRVGPLAVAQSAPPLICHWCCSSTNNRHSLLNQVHYSRSTALLLL